MSLLLRHATVLRNKLKDDKYTFLAQTFGYPSTTQLNNYSSSSWKEEDGPCNDILERKRCEFENNNNFLDKLNFRRMGSLSQDAMMTKEKLNFDKHGMRIIGTADDSFNEKGIDLELKLFTKKYENETANNSREATDETANNSRDATDETSTTDKTSTNFKKKKGY